MSDEWETVQVICPKCKNVLAESDLKYLGNNEFAYRDRFYECGCPERKNKSLHYLGDGEFEYREPKEVEH